MKGKERASAIAQLTNPLPAKRQHPLCPNLPTSYPALYLWPVKAAYYVPFTWQDLKEAPGFRWAELWPMWPFGERTSD